MKRLLIGLGNIGSAYRYTRHNVGFLVMDYLALQQKVRFRAEHLALLASFSYNQHEVYILKPTTYMNHSGKAVHHWLHALDIPIEESLTVVDDINLPFGTMRLRAQGGDAGHNGLKNIAACLSSKGYPRLRMGIGSHFSKDERADFVLADFSPKELRALPLDQACALLLTWCEVGIAQTMNQFNKK